MILLKLQVTFQCGFLQNFHCVHCAGIAALNFSHQKHLFDNAAQPLQSTVILQFVITIS